MNPPEAVVRAYLRRTLGFPDDEIEGILDVGRTALDQALAELERAARGGDPGRLSDAAHAVKGMLRNMGLVECAAMARRMEDMAWSGAGAESVETAAQLRRRLDPFLHPGGAPGKGEDRPMDRTWTKA